MKKSLCYVLAGFVCFVIFVAFSATGVGAFVLVLFWNAIIVRVWKSITALAKEDNKEETENIAE
ncbi:MAG: hypothetical protein EOM76_00180 [Sphingobacteriia bacterium]|nr:hypothetical protein [Sphingobacteriia bacterium]